MRTTLIVAALSMMAAAGTAHAQQATTPPAELSPMDYIEIQQLAIRYAYGLDTAADNGYMYANVFTPDGEFIGRQTPFTKGRDALARVARSVRKANPMFVRHFIAKRHTRCPGVGPALLITDTVHGYYVHGY